MTTLLRLVYLACAVCIAWFGVQYAIEAAKNRDGTTVVWTIAATGLVVACLIDWAIERKRA